MELGGADAVTADQDPPEALGVASPCAGDDADEAGVMPQGLLEEIQYRAFCAARRHAPRPSAGLMARPARSCDARMDCMHRSGTSLLLAFHDG